MQKKFFQILYRSNKSQARLAQINTQQGIVQTPAFVPVATKATLKTLTPDLIKKIGVQIAFVNTYHLVNSPGAELIEKSGGIHQFSRLGIPLMSDSGGFQVFSLAKNKHKRRVDIHGDEQPLMIKISEKGVKFRSLRDGKIIEFSPEKSMDYQIKIGANLVMAFDECVYNNSTHRYAEKSMLRTHQWLKRSIKYFYKHRKKYQFLYGIIQGADFEDLRKKSAQFVSRQPVDGVAIGGVSVGESKKQMRDQIRWVADYLPKKKPVHLLGVGHIDDILDLVKYGIDTFDCVEPTRLARMGRIYQWKKIEKYLLTKVLPQKKHFDIDIQKNIYSSNLSSLDNYCSCYTCKNFTKAYLHHLFKQREILGYTLATFHNLVTIEKLFKKIREMIREEKEI